MINSTGALVYGEFFNNTDVDQIYVSEKFTSVDKIITCGNTWTYLLSCGNIYYDDTMSDDNFTKIIAVDATLKFTNIVALNNSCCAICLGTDFKLYVIYQNIIRIKNIRDNVVNIYGGNIGQFMYKNDKNEHYIGLTPYDDNPGIFLGIFDSIYYYNNGYLAIYDNKILYTKKYYGEKLKFLDENRVDIVTLKMIPSGSILDFYDGNDNKISYSGIIPNHNKILYHSSYFDAIHICCSTKNVYDNNYNIIPKLKGCLFDRLDNMNRRARTKNANYR